MVTPISVQGLLAEVQAGAEAFCQQQGCALHMEAPEPDLCLLANSSALAGAINNLIANAQQAGATSLLVSAVRSGARVEMRVIDNGKGIPSHQLGQVFEPFFTTRSRGTGLGLAVVQSVVRAHQGRSVWPRFPVKAPALLCRSPCTSNRCSLRCSMTQARSR